MMITLWEFPGPYSDGDSEKILGFLIVVIAVVVIVLLFDTFD